MYTLWNVFEQMSHLNPPFWTRMSTSFLDTAEGCLQQKSTENISKKAALQFIWICRSFEILYTLLSNQTTLWCCFIFWGNGNHIYSSSLIRVNANNYHDKTLKQAKNSWLLMCTAKNQWNRKIALFNKC